MKGMVLCEGMQVDVLDTSDIYCPASIISINEQDVKIRYVGWGKKYDSVVSLQMIFPAFTKVRPTRGWVKLDKTLPHWPCIVYLRTPKEDSEDGIHSLELEPKVFVMPFGNLTHRFLKPYAYGMWQDVPLISPFMVECKERQEAGLTASTGIKNMFSLALEQAQDFVTDRGKQDVNFQTLKGSHFHWEDSLRETSGSAQDGVDIDSPVAQTTKTKSTFYSPKTTTTTPTIIDVSESVTTSTSTSTSSSSSSTSTSSQTSHGQSNPHEESPGSCQGLSLNLMQLAVGDVVSVASRTWPGINKPGGIGHVRKITPISPTSDSDPSTVLFSVAYVLGGKENNIPMEYVTPHQLHHPESERSTKRIKRLSGSSPTQSDDTPSPPHTTTLKKTPPKKKVNKEINSQKKTSPKTNKQSILVQASSKNKPQQSSTKRSSGPDRSKISEAPAVWVNCDACHKWRRLPHDASVVDVGGSTEWFCSMNSHDINHNACSKPEEDLSMEMDIVKPHETTNSTTEQSGKSEKKTTKGGNVISSSKAMSSTSVGDDQKGKGTKASSNLTAVPHDGLDHTCYLSPPRLGKAYLDLLASITTTKAKSSSLSSSSSSSSSSTLSSQSLLPVTAEVVNNENIGSVSIEFTSRWLNSLGMGNDLVLLTPLKLMLTSGLVVPTQFMDDLLHHAVGLLHDDRELHDLSPLWQQRLAAAAMLDLVTNFPVAVSHWSPALPVVDKILAALLLCTSLRYSCLVSTTSFSDGQEHSGVKRDGDGDDDGDNSGRDNSVIVPPVTSTLPYVLDLARFVAIHYVPPSRSRSPSPPPVVIIKLPVPAPTELDLASANVGNYLNLCELRSSICGSTTSARFDISHPAREHVCGCGWLQMGAVHRAVLQLQSQQHQHQRLDITTPVKTSNGSIAPSRDKENAKSSVVIGSSPSKRPLQESSLNILDHKQLTSQGDHNVKKQKQVTQVKQKIKSKKASLVPLTVPYSPQEVMELCVLKPLGLLFLGTILEAKVRAARARTRPPSSSESSDKLRANHWLREMVKEMYTSMVRLDCGSATAVSTSSLRQLHTIRRIHCHIDQMDELLEEVLVLYLSL